MCLGICRGDSVGYSNVDAIRSGYVSMVVHTACLITSVCSLYVSISGLELYVFVFKRGGADPPT